VPDAAAAARAFRALLRAYPRAFRERHGREMELFFRDRWAEGRGAGRGRLAIWGETLLDLAASAPREHLRAVVGRRRRGRPPHDQHTPPSGEPMQTLLQDARYAARTLARRPGFAAAAVLTLALGIGATTAVFSVVHAVLLRPLPWRDADRVVAAFATTPRSQSEAVSWPEYQDWVRGAPSFAGLAIVRGQSVNLTGGGAPPDRLVGSFATASLFPVLGAEAALGRTFAPAETEEATAQPVAVASHGLWQERFGGDSSILGRTLTLNGRTVTIVGVMPRGFETPYGTPDVWLPLPFYPNTNGLSRQHASMLAIGRLRPGATPEQARAELQAVERRLAAEYPELNAGRGARVVAMREVLVGDARPVLLTLFAAVLVVLLIACTNVANLQLVRAAARRREISVRAALGASASRIARQLLTESLLLAAAGGALGLLLAHWGVAALGAVIPASLPVFGGISLEPAVLGFAVAITLGTGLLFGLVPALHAARAGLGAALATRGGTGAARGGVRGVRGGVRGAFVVAQVALSIVLLVPAGLLIRSLLELQRVRPGFDPRGVLTMEYRLPVAKYREPAQIVAFMTQAIARIREVPGVRSAALARAIPFSGNSDGFAYLVEGRPAPAPGTTPLLQLNTVSDGYFRTLGIPLLGGRDFTARDAAEAPPVIIVNRTFAEREWPGESPLGRRVMALGGREWMTVVGVVGDARHFTLADVPAAQAYLPYAQNPAVFSSVAVRVEGSAAPESLGPAVRAAIWSVDRDQPVWKLRSLETLMGGSLVAQRLTTRLLAGFAAAALLLAGLGIYGVMSHAVAQRTREVGIRMALGARGAQVLRQVLGEGMVLTALAAALGLAGAFAATRLLSSQLYGVSAKDPATFATVPLILAAVALAACYLPARRASRVDPVEALREE